MAKNIQAPDDVQIAAMNIEYETIGNLMTMFDFGHPDFATLHLPAVPAAGQRIGSDALAKVVASGLLQAVD